MRKLTSTVLAVFLFLLCIYIAPPDASAAVKSGDTRAIAIVFDNSGSMYLHDNQAWCRATYATEVFASMLNKGDILQIYPMNPFKIGDKEYSMDNPFQITDASQAYLIRDIYTEGIGDTHIESMDSAISGLKKLTADKKYLVVLSDGEDFYRNRLPLGQDESRRQLDSYFREANEDMVMMYLGIDSIAIVPETPESEFFVKKKATNSVDVLATLTEICNRIFGRDTLPKNHISGKTINFDISMSKLIVFVQGENISDLKVTGESGEIWQPTSTATAKYATTGGNFKCVPDISLQGMMVTYEDCDAGTCTIDYSGKATSVEIYYEPNADLDFVFTDTEGNPVNPDALYEGEYTVSFGMMDAKTGELISSDLLGTPQYRGSYFINDEETKITHDGHSGFESVNLKMDDTFDANLTVTYLSGYSITKDSTDFGWPFGGIKVAARPAGNLKLEISDGEDIYSLQDLNKGKPYIAKIYHEGNLLTGEELKKVVLEWNPDSSNAEIKQDFADDHYNLYLDYKDPSNPQDTKCGKCTVTIFASYQAEGSDNSQAQKSLSYMIRDDFAPLLLDLYAPNSYITIKDIEASQPAVVGLSIKGKKLTDADFDAVKLTVDCGGIEYTVTPDKKESAYLIKLLPTENISEGNYTINVTAEYTDHIGRVTQTEDSVTVTLSLIPLWVKWLFWIVILLLIALIIWLWLRTPVLPNKIRITNISVKVGGKPMSMKASTVYSSKGKKRNIKIAGTGDLSAARWSATLIPAKDSYRYLPSKKRKAMVVSGSVKAAGYVDKIDIGAESFARNKKDNSLFRISESVKDFTFPQGTINYSGEKDINGKPTKYVISGDIKFE